MSWYEYKFDKQRWLDSYQYEEGQHRIFGRGFAPFIADALDIAFNKRPKTHQAASICELGIGGGGSHGIWDQTIKANIYGVDIYSPDEHAIHHHLHKNEMKHELQSNYKSMQHAQKKFTQCKFFCGVDGYTKQARDLVINHNQAPLTVLYDDSDPTGSGLNRLLPTWKNSIESGGFIISTTLFRQGTVESKEIEKNPAMINSLVDQAKSQGYIVFDFTKYQRREILVDHCVSKLCFWSPNMNQYQLLFDFYNDCML